MSTLLPDSETLSGGYKVRSLSDMIPLCQSRTAHMPGVALMTSGAAVLMSDKVSLLSDSDYVYARKGIDVFWCLIAAVRQ